jgi:hypothetical protein
MQAGVPLGRSDVESRDALLKDDCGGEARSLASLQKLFRG